jgi:hypothetical protein
MLLEGRKISDEIFAFDQLFLPIILSVIGVITRKEAHAKV